MGLFLQLSCGVCVPQHATNASVVKGTDQDFFTEINTKPSKDHVQGRIKVFRLDCLSQDDFNQIACLFSAFW